MTSKRERELEKKITLLEQRLEQLSTEKVNLEIELETLKAELDVWKRKFQALSENLRRMGNGITTEKLSEVPKPKTRPASGSKNELNIDVAEAVILALQNDLIRRGVRTKPGVYREK